MTAWSTDIKSAPHGRYVVKQRKEGVDMRVFVPEPVILTTKCGKTVLSHYLPEKKRWMMLGEGEQPLAWMPWPEPYSKTAPDPHLSVGSNGDPSIPSPEAGGAKMDEHSSAHPDRAAPAENQNANSGQAVPHSISDGLKSRPGDAAASLTQQSSSPRQERPSAEERSSDRSGGQFGDAPKPAHIQRADGGADITMTHSNIAGA